MEKDNYQERCAYCKRFLSFADRLPIVLGTKAAHICIACDDRLQEVTHDESDIEQS